MKIFSMLKSIILTAVLLGFIIQAHTHAEEYKWLKTSKYKKVLVYTDFNNCDFIDTKLKETIKRTLLSHDIESTISDSLAFQTTEKRGKITREELDPKLTSGNKIILYIHPCFSYFNNNLAIDFNFMDNIIALDESISYNNESGILESVLSATESNNTQNNGGDKSPNTPATMENEVKKSPIKGGFDYPVKYPAVRTSLSNPLVPLP